MTEKTRLAIILLFAALLLGICADLLLRATPWGINLLLIIGALTATALWLAKRHNAADFAQDRRWLLAPALGFAATFSWRDSTTLNLISILALIVALSLMALRTRSGWLRIAGLIEYLLGLVMASFGAVIGTILLLCSDIKWQEIPRGKWSNNLLAASRGLIIAVPLLLVFGGLLMAADAVFEKIINNVISFGVDNLFFHTFMICGFAWLFGGYLRSLLIDSEFRLPAEKPAFFSLGIIEIGTMLALLNLLFLGFVIVQLRYLFGGAALVLTSTGLTYAEYARRGFFELVTVAALVLPILLASHWLLRKENNPSNLSHLRIYNTLAGGQIVLLSIIMLSAVQRMRLYQNEYGMTELRLYTVAFMAWLAIVFVWFALTVLRGQREHFAFGALISGFLMIGLLHAINPDAYIARANITRAANGKSFDVNYCTSLSADATIEILQGLPALNERDRGALAISLLDKFNLDHRPDLRTWNYARATAWQAINQNRVMLSELKAKFPKSPESINVNQLDQRD